MERIATAQNWALEAGGSRIGLSVELAATNAVGFMIVAPEGETVAVHPEQHPHNIYLIIHTLRHPEVQEDYEIGDEPCLQFASVKG